MHLLLVEILYDFSHILGVPTCGDQQCIFSLDHYEVTDSDGCHEFFGSVDVVAVRVQHEHARTCHQIGFRWATLGIVMFV